MGTTTKIKSLLAFLLLSFFLVACGAQDSQAPEALADLATSETLVGPGLSTSNETVFPDSVVKLFDAYFGDETTIEAADDNGAVGSIGSGPNAPHIRLTEGADGQYVFSFNIIATSSGATLQEHCDFKGSLSIMAQAADFMGTIWSHQAEQCDTSSEIAGVIPFKLPRNAEVINVALVSDYFDEITLYDTQQFTIEKMDIDGAIKDSVPF